jgi:hypothetical protein
MGKEGILGKGWGCTKLKEKQDVVVQYSTFLFVIICHTFLFFSLNLFCEVCFVLFWQGEVVGFELKPFAKQELYCLSHTAVHFALVILEIGSGWPEP